MDSKEFFDTESPYIYCIMSKKFLKLAFFSLDYSNPEMFVIIFCQID